MTDTPAGLQLEADAALAAAPAEPPPPGAELPAGELGPSAADVEAGYQVLGDAMLAATFRAACPAWEVTDVERGKLAGALAHAASLWFPQGLPPKWAALIVVAGVGFEIVSARIEVDSEGNKRLRPPRRSAAPAEAPAAPAPDPHAPIN